MCFIFDDFPLKIISLACLFIMIADGFIFHQLLVIQDQVQLSSMPEVFHDCYKPQIRMRLIFTGYAINSAFVCFVLTWALICFEENSHRFETMINYITDYMFIIFGPVLFCFCIMGFTCLPGLAQECKPDHAGPITHQSDISVLVICTIMSFCVLFLYAAQITGRLSD